jgi:polysaccharide biosynthesis transport protein
MPDELVDQVPRGGEEYLAILFRRRMWILLPLFLCWAAVWGMSWLLPTSYQSEALILVEQQKVPDQYVVPNVTMNLQDRLQSLKQQVFSRTRLQATIDRFQLYPPHDGLRSLLKAGDPIDQMRNDIKIELVDSPSHPGDFAAFKIHYTAGSPQLAQQVNSELTSLFVGENAKAQTQLSENTTAFLASQLADARAKMEEQEARVAAFKAKHVGDLPGQLESNVQILVGLQAQLQNTQRALDAAKQQGIYLQSLLQEYQSAQASLGSGDATVISTEALDKELMDLRLRLQDLHSRYTDDHPDIVALKDSIAKSEKLKQQIEGEVASNQRAGKATKTVDLAAAEGLQRGSPTAMMQVESQLKANQLEIQNYQQHEKDLERQNSAYQARLNMTPGTEQELTDISRGYEESKSNYNSLLQKQMQSQLATSLEQQQQGEQFRIIDPPSLPNKPSAPNHFWISLSGLILGGAVGLCLAAFLELTDVRVRQEKDLEGLVPVSVLVGIPRLSTPKEEQTRQKTQWIELGAAVAMAILIAVGNLYAFYKG